MAEIAVLRTQIINYVKTRDTYVAYRKAGYSKKFKAEHEADILLHQAAKKYFDSLGLKKLPTVKALWNASQQAANRPVPHKRRSGSLKQVSVHLPCLPVTRCFQALFEK